MLHVDYTVKTKQGVDETLHTPDGKLTDIPDNIIMIEGPNSSGKSTLMNLIAIGSYGEDDESLSDSMRSNLKELTESSYRKVSFDITIEDPVTGTELQMVKKESGEPSVFENGQPIDRSEFRRRYQLVYDIPENPTARLKSITKAVRDDHTFCLERLNSFNGYVRSINESLKGQLTAADISEKRRSIEATQKVIDSLKRSGWSDSKILKMKIAENIAESYDLEEAIKNLDRKIDFEMSRPQRISGGPDGSRSSDRDLEKYLADLEVLRPKQSALAQKTGNTEISNDYDRLNILWGKVTRDNIEEHSDILKEIENVADDLLEHIPDIQKERENLQAVNKAIEAVAKIDRGQRIGHIGSVNDIIEALVEFKSTIANEEEVSMYLTIRDEANRIRNSVIPLSQKSQRIVKQPETRPPVMYRDEEKLGQLRNAKKNKKSRLDEVNLFLASNYVTPKDKAAKFHTLCNELGLKYPSNKEEIHSALEEAKKSRSETDKRVSRLESVVKTEQSKIDEYLSNPRPRYLDDRERIGDILDAIRTIRGKISSANERLDDIDEGNDLNYRQNPNLYKPIWEYIGQKLGTVRDKGKEYSVEYVDLLIEPKGLIHTTDGTEIHIGAMGTGEGQLSYIRGLLSSDDDRMKIVMLDEIGNMSNATIEYVRNSLEELQKEGRLLVGIMVRPGDRMEVTTYGI